MQAEALTGGFAVPPIDAAKGFRAALDALARPGRIETLSGAQAPAPVSTAAATLLLVLCDPETPVYLAGDYDSEAVRQWLAFHTGAPVVAPNHAVFALGRWADLLPLNTYRIGTPDYPDRSATLIVEQDKLVSQGAVLRGPGIKKTAALNLPETRAFQANRTLFPQGLDFFFTCKDHVAGVPRSTIVEDT